MWGIVGHHIDNLKVKKQYLNEVRKLGDDFSITFAFELLELDEYKAINYLNSIGYDVHVNNLYTILPIAYYKETMKNRFRVSSKGLDCWIVGDTLTNAMMMKANGYLTLGIPLQTVNGMEVFTLSLEA